MIDFAPWYTIAQAEIGVRETPGAQATPRVIEYHSATTLKATSDEIAWCSSCVCWCLEQSGVRSTRSARARSYLDYGVRLREPVRGCIVVLQRGDNPAQGHVAFYVGRSLVPGMLRVLGGNQGNAVSIARRRRDDVLAYVWPAGQPLPPYAQVA